MTTPATPSAPTPAAGPNKPAAEGQAPAASPIDERLHGFWKDNGRTILGVCVVALVLYIGNGIWEYWGIQKEAAIEADFAACSTPEKFKAFAAAHPGHTLAGIAELRLADAAYASQRSAEAADGYAKAAADLKATPLGSRAQLGLAMSQIQAGKASEGETALRQLAADLRQFKAVRVEATYQLASLAASAGRPDEVQKLALQAMQIDANSPWAQRAFGLQAKQVAQPPAQPAPAPKPATK